MRWVLLISNEFTRLCRSPLDQVKQHAMVDCSEDVHLRKPVDRYVEEVLGAREPSSFYFYVFHGGLGWRRWEEGVHLTETEVFLMTAATQGKRASKRSPPPHPLGRSFGCRPPFPILFLSFIFHCMQQKIPLDFGITDMVWVATRCWHGGWELQESHRGDTGVRLAKIVVKIQTCKVGRNKKQSLRFCHAQPYTAI